MATKKKASRKAAKKPTRTPARNATKKARKTARPNAKRQRQPAARDLRQEVGEVKRAIARLNAWVEQAEGQLAGNVDASAQLCMAVTEIDDRNSVSVLSCTPPV